MLTGTKLDEAFTVIDPDEGVPWHPVTELTGIIW